MRKSVRCPVCGRIMKSEKICSGCGYDSARDYEMYPTLAPIPNHTASVLAKHLEQEKKTKNPYISDGKKAKKRVTIVVPIIIVFFASCIALVFILMIGATFKPKPDIDVEENNSDTQSTETVIEKESKTENPNMKSTEVVDLGDIDNNQDFDSLEVGKTVSFGLYEQDNTDSGKEEIEWVILDKNEKSLLLISKYALDTQPYNKSYTYVTWETCSLREWLISEFLKTAFTDEEQAIIQKGTFSADENPDYDSDQDNSMANQVFLLSIAEVKQYLSSDENRKCVPTDYAVKQGALTSFSSKLDGKATCWWWLRSVEGYGSVAPSLNTDGVVNANGLCVNDVDVGVRPALWVNLESVIQ